jgi:hypothetical protein
MGVMQSDTQPSPPGKVVARGRVGLVRRRVRVVAAVGVPLAGLKTNFETRFSLYRLRGLKPGAFQALWETPGRNDTTLHGRSFALVKTRFNR